MFEGLSLNRDPKLRACNEYKGKFITNSLVYRIYHTNSNKPNSLSANKDTYICTCMPFSSFFGPSFPAKIEAVTSNNNNNFGNEKKAILFIACKNASPALNAVRARRNFIKFSCYIM